MRGPMKYQFTLHTTASELWQLFMYGIYGSMLGMINVVFTAAMILLAVRFFSSAHFVLKGLLVIAISLFTVIQPLLAYLRARKQAKSLPQEVRLGFDDEGMHISMGDQKSDVAWDAVRGITRKPTLLVIFSSARHGFVLSNKVLGEHKEAFYQYITTKIKKRK